METILVVEVTSTWRSAGNQEEGEWFIPEPYPVSGNPLMAAGITRHGCPDSRSSAQMTPPGIWSYASVIRFLPNTCSPEKAKVSRLGLTISEESLINHMP